MCRGWQSGRPSESSTIFETNGSLWLSFKAFSVLVHVLTPSLPTQAQAASTLSFQLITQPDGFQCSTSAENPATLKYTPDLNPASLLICSFRIRLATCSWPYIEPDKSSKYMVPSRCWSSLCRDSTAPAASATSAPVAAAAAVAVITAASVASTWPENAML